MSIIKLTDAAKYYADILHQNQALEWLQSQISASILEEFATRWRNAPEVPAVASKPIAAKNYLRLTRTSKKDSYGGIVLFLDYFKNGKLEGSIECCSGAPSRQNFRKGANSVAGSLEPIPEGRWYVHDILWAGGKDNYSGAIHLPGLGPATVCLDFVGPGKTGRRNIEIHIDWNRKTSPGTAGCIGLYGIPDYRKFVGWLRDTNPRDLYVDWGLGSCPTP